MKKRQRELYLDVDRRLSGVEREGAVTAQPLPVSENPLAKPPEAPGTESQSEQVSAEQLQAERSAYQAAFNMLRELRYEQAITAFREFMTKYPDGKYAHIAQYWLGEANYARREFKQAAQDYQVLIDKYANSPKVIEAKLKIGYCFYELENFTEAAQHMEALVQKHPDTTEASEAQRLINSMKKSEKSE